MAVAEEQALDDRFSKFAEPATEPLDDRFSKFADSSKSYDTPLKPQEEAQFKTWKAKYAPRDSGVDYDLRGAFKAGLTPDPQSGHWPDTFKKPNHPTFSNESQYAVGPDAAKAGYWAGPNHDQFVAPGQNPPERPYVASAGPGQRGMPPRAATPESSHRGAPPPVPARPLPPDTSTPEQPLPEVLTQPVSKTLGGKSFAEAADQALPKAPIVGASGYARELNRFGLQTAAGVLDWMQTPLGIATLLAHASTEGADAVIMPILGPKFTKDAYDGAKSAVEDMVKNGPSVERVEQLVSSGLMGIGALAGAKQSEILKPRAELESSVKTAQAIQEPTKTRAESVVAEEPIDSRFGKFAESPEPVQQPLEDRFAQHAEPTSTTTVTINGKSTTTTNDIRAEIARLRAENEKLRGGPEKPAAQSAPTEAPPTPEVAPAEQPAQPEAVPEQESEVPASEPPSSSEPNTKEPQAVVLAPEEAPAPAQDVAPPIPESRTLAESHEELKTHPARGTANQLFTGPDYARPKFEERLKAGAANATDAQLEDYLAKLKATAQAHLPENEALASDIDRADQALESGNKDAFALAAEDARAKISTGFHEHLTAETAKKFGIELPKAEETVFQARTGNGRLEYRPPVDLPREVWDSAPKVSAVEAKTSSAPTGTVRVFGENGFADIPESDFIDASKKGSRGIADRAAMMKKGVAAAQQLDKASLPEIPLARESMIAEGAHSEMQAWAQSVRDVQGQQRAERRSGESAMTRESNAAGKEIEEQQDARANGIRSLGVKEGSPLEKFEEDPETLAKVIEDQGGRQKNSKRMALYKAIQKAFADQYEEDHGEAIDNHLARNAPEAAEPLAHTKLVDASGQPKKMYHGTYADVEGELKPGDSAAHPTRGFIWFTSKAGEAESGDIFGARHYGSNIHEAYLDIRNPYYGDIDELHQDKIGPKELAAKGYDGFIDKTGGSGFAAVIRPEQIISADRAQFAEEEEPESFNFGANAVEHLSGKIEESNAKIADMIRSVAQGKTLGANLPLEAAAELAKNGAMRIARGTIKFADWSVEMVKQFGEEVRPLLRDIYDKALERVQAAKDAGVDLRSKQGQALLSGSLGSEGKYVKNEEFKFKFGKNDKGTGKELRQEFAGLKNADIVRGQHLVDTIKRIVPDALERKGMFWYKAARGDLDMIREAIQDPHFKEYVPELEKALTLSDKAKRALEEVGTYYAEAGRVSKEVGTIGKVREEYQNRIYAPEPPQDYVKSGLGGGVRPFTGHAKARVFDTEFDAVKAGKKFAVTDIADALGIHSEEMAKVNTSRKLANIMADNNIGGWVREGKIPAGWKPVEGLEKNTPIRDENGEAVINAKTGNQVVNRTVFAAPEGIQKAIRSVTDPDFLRKIDALRSIQKYQGLVKTVDLSYSFFHHFTMAMQALYQGNYRGLGDLSRMTKTMDTPAFREMETDFARHGGITAKIEANQDILRDLAKKEPGTFSKIANLPVVRQALHFADKNTNFLFGKMQRLLKVQDYAGKVANWVSNHPDATNEEVVTAKRAIARQNNAAYGGLNWEAMGMTRTNLSLLRTGLLAPDWTISNGQLVTQAFKKGPEGSAARAHYVRAAIIGMVATEGLSKLLTGHTTDQNPAGHKLEVQIAPGVWVSFLRGGVGDLVKYWSNLEQNGPLEGSAQFAQAKLGPITRTVVGGLTNTEYSGTPIARAKSPGGKTADYASYILRSAGPVPFGVGNLAKYAEDRQATPLGAAGVATGVARYAPVKRRRR